MKRKEERMTRIQSLEYQPGRANLLQNTPIWLQSMNLSLQTCFSLKNTNVLKAVQQVVGRLPLFLEMIILHLLDSYILGFINLFCLKS